LRRIKGGFTKIGRSLFFIALNYIIFKKNILLVTNVTYMELLIGYRVDRKMNDEEIKEEELWRIRCFVINVKKPPVEKVVRYREYAEKSRKLLLCRTC